jgi:hypothetical protein
MTQTIHIIDRFSGVIETVEVPEGRDPAATAIDALEPWTESHDVISHRRTEGWQYWEIESYGEAIDIYAATTNEEG